MIRNAFATRLASMAGVALSVAGLGALDAAAQGTVTLSGGTGTSCQYSGISIAPNGNLTVTCDNGNVTVPPTCNISGPTSATVGQAFVLTANCTPAASSWAWTGVSPAPNSATATINPNATGTLTFTVTGTNSIGTGAASPAHSVNVAAAQLPTDVPRNCTFSSNPAAPQVGQATTITISCTNSPNAFAWYQYEGGAAGLPNQTTVGSQTVTFTAAGKYSWWLQAGNQLGSGDVFSGSVDVGSPVGQCPAVTTVGPASSASLLQLNFNLKPGQIGSQVFTYPFPGNAGIRVTAAGATSAETPNGTVAEIAVADCPGSFDVPASCKFELWGRSTINQTYGDALYSNCPLTGGTKYLNIRHKTCVPSGFNGIQYCSAHLSISGAN